MEYTTAESDKKSYWCDTQCDEVFGLFPVLVNRCGTRIHFFAMFGENGPSQASPRSQKLWNMIFTIMGRTSDSNLLFVGITVVEERMILKLKTSEAACQCIPSALMKLFISTLSRNLHDLWSNGTTVLLNDHHWSELSVTAHWNLYFPGNKR